MESRKSSKSKLVITLLTSVIVSFVCFIVVVFSYTLVVDNISKDNDIFFWGYKPIVIISESMEPTMKVNGISVIKQVDRVDEIEIEDIIMFNTESHGLVMHRVVDKDGYGLITKGDNNLHSDTWRVTDKDLKGKVVKTYNFIADTVTFLFGDLVNIDPNRLVFGFGVLTVCVVLLIVVLNYIYEDLKSLLDILVYKNKALIKESNYEADKLKKEEIYKFINVDNYKMGILDRIILRYYAFKLRIRIKKDEENAEKSRKIFDRAYKKITKIENKNVNKN